MKRLIEWFIDNPVASNLLMFLVIIGGLMTAFGIKQELFPQITPPFITISVAYPGAAPEEVEQSITIRVEEAVFDIEGVDRLTSTSAENVALVTLQLEKGYTPDDVVDEVKARVDAIDNFPEESEKPVIRKVEMKPHVVNVTVGADTDEGTLKRLAERVREELTALPEISQVTIANARPYEVSIEVSEESLRRHGLTFDEVAMAVRKSSVDLPGGIIKAEGGEILLRSQGKAETGAEFAKLPLRTLPDGSRLLLDDVAKVTDGFEETDVRTRFNGKPALILQVFRVGDQGVLEVAHAVKRYAAEAHASLPAGVELNTYWDNSRILRGRMDLLIRNGLLGLGLVAVLLLLFFRVRLAFWVAMGMFVAILGAIWLMPAMDVSVNLLSLFAFIVVLGILVDDAIVVSENVYRFNQLGYAPLEAAKRGTLEVTVPVILAVTTTIAAFFPMLLIPGIMGDFAEEIPKVVMACLAFSLVEALIILPTHLRHLRTRGANLQRGFLSGWTRMQDRFAAGLDWFIVRVYRPTLAATARWRYVTLSFGVGTLILTVGLFAGGWMKFTFFPPIDADYAVAFVSMPLGTPSERTAEVMKRLEESALKLRAEMEAGRPGTVFRHVVITVGTQPVRIQQDQNRGGLGTLLRGGHLGEAAIELVPAEDRADVTSAEIIRRWRELTGPIPGVEELNFTADLMSRGKPLDIRLAASDTDDLREAADRLKLKLQEYPGVFDVTDSFRAGKQELRLGLKPAAEAAGLTEGDLARQVRQGYYGEEAQRISREREDVKVMVRYPLEERRTLASIEHMRVRLPRGGEAPFSTFAEVHTGRSPAAIQRSERSRSINVTGDLDLTKGNANEIMQDLEEGFLPGLTAEFPGLRYSLEGQQREQAETMQGVQKGMVIALVVIYAMLAVPLKSYLQPGIIMLAIPFGVAGAVWAHFFLGMIFTFMSLIGVMALMGVVVNDSLIMIDFINRARAEGMSPAAAVLKSGPVRFRAILITSLTTFAGLTPMLLEKSMQAKFLIPMAVSLAYGVMFATGVTLIIVPCTYLILEDVRRWLRGSRSAAR